MYRNMPRKCKNEHCTNAALTRRTFSSSCRYIRLKQENPVRIAYDNVKGSAKRRNKEFTISKEYFATFCKETQYLQLKGRLSTSLHVDRIDETRGYTDDNIQSLQNSDNVKKYRKFVDRQNGVPIFTTITVSSFVDDEPSEDCPF